MRAAFAWLRLIGSIALLIALGQLPPVQALSRRIDEARSWLLPLTLGGAIAGMLGLLAGLVLTAARSGRPMTEEELERLAARTQVLGPGKAFSVARLRGKSRGIEVPEDRWTFAELKEGWRSGAWRRGSDMQRKLLITVGGILLVLGGFATCAVLVGPPSARLLLVGTVLYACVRLAWGFREA